MNFYPIFLGDISGTGRPCQSNLDFLMPPLSGPWDAWHHQFAAAGIRLGRTGADLRSLLVGPRRAAS